MDLGVSTQYRLTLKPDEFRLVMKALRLASSIPGEVLIKMPSPPTSAMQNEMAELQEAMFKSQQSQLKGFAAHAEKISKEEA